MNSHMTSSFTKRQNPVNFNRLNRFLSMNLPNKTLWVEGGLNMQEIAKKTLDFGLIPAVLPEFKEITVAGAVMGAALESASFKHGQFSDQCLAYELVLEDGQNIICSEADYADLFHGVSGSYGSLAKLSAAKIRLKKTKPYVRIDYELLADQSKLWPLKDFHKIDYLDALVFESGETILSKAKAVGIKEIPYGLEGFNRLAANWYIQNIEKKVLNGEIYTEYWTLFEYLFRYDLSAFWMGQFTTSSPLRYLFPLGKNSLKKHLITAFEKYPPSISPSFLFRLFCNWKLSSRSLYKALHKFLGKDLEDLFIIQDFYIPSPKIEEFLDFVEREIKIYPLWLCPVKSSKKAQILSPHFLQERATLPQFTNVGIYGRPQKRKDIKGLHKELEKIALGLGGRKMLYGKNYYSKEDFWKIYDKKSYNSLREKYVPEKRFEDFYHRTCS